MTVSANAYCMIAGQLEFMGFHDFEMLPRAGEYIILPRFGEDVTLVVDRVEHKIGPMGHTARLICSKSA